MSSRAETGASVVPKPSDTSKSKSAPETGSGPENESLQRRKRRSYTAEYKRRIVKEASLCTEPGETKALLRREGLYSSHLNNWRKAFEAGGTAALVDRPAGRKPKQTAEQRRIEELEKKQARLERELHIAHKLIELQKKASEILGITLEPPPEDDD